MTKAAKKKQAEEEEEEEAEDLASAPLFAAVNRAGKRIDRVSVRRLEPNSGFMGIMPPNVTEDMIFAKWGGGDYRLEAKNDAGGILKVRAYKIAGDPQFASEAEERTWRRQNGLEPVRGRGAGSDVKEMLAIMEERDDKRRAELLEREDRTRKDADAREERDRRQREERDAIARRDEEQREERRRREAREDDDRRTRAHREDLERITAQNAAALAQNQQYFTQLAATMKADERSSSAAIDPVKTLITGIQLARDLGGDAAAAPDFLTALVSRLPETLQEVRRTAGAALAEIKGGAGAGGKRPAGLKPGEDFLTITGKVATKAKALAMKIRAAGGNPEQAIDRMLTMATAAADAGAPPAPAAAPARSTKAAPTQIRAAAKIARRRRAAPRGPRARRTG